MFKRMLIMVAFFLCSSSLLAEQQVSLFWWTPSKFRTNFGDALSPLIVERILTHSLIKNKKHDQQMLAIGSILHFAKDGDVVWGSGVNGKIVDTKYVFSRLDVRAVRGPLTRQFLLSRGIYCPQIYGDPALLMPLLFPELKVHPITEYIVIPNKNEIDEFKNFPNLVLPTQDCMIVVGKILKAKFVISGSLHGIVVAEAFGIPARLLKITKKEPMFKYKDYYWGTGRKKFKVARSLDEAFSIGGESRPIVNLKKLLESFPYDKF